MAETLAAWGQACDTVLACIEEQVTRANVEKQKATYHKERIQRDVSNICSEKVIKYGKACKFVISLLVDC